MRYQVDDAFGYAFNCHCSQCRRATGSALKPCAGTERTRLRLRLQRGENDLLIHGNADAAHDVHCRHCGSLLYSVVREGAFARVTMGTLVDTPSIRPQGHIFVGSRAPWHEIADTLPQYDEFPS
ncbi:GFA family protein [Paraburkholderia sp. A3BS-1L]|uniref:GFA family protein n=1 Tax=Paraburkholderia sp. A3BS-1L TaxID=3028375 RepID=UPI003DA8BB36